MSIEDEVEAILAGRYEIKELDWIPAKHEASLENVAYKINAVAFAIDMRDSSSLLDDHRRETAAKLYRAFLKVVAHYVHGYGGTIRFFGGDGALAFWPGATQDSARKAVDCALRLNHSLRAEIAGQLAKSQLVDFGIGIAASDVLVVKAGTDQAKHSSDLVFVGECVNLSVKLSKSVGGGKPIGITRVIHDCLAVDRQYADPDALWLKEPYWEEGEVRVGNNEYAVMVLDYEGSGLHLTDG